MVGRNGFTRFELILVVSIIAFFLFTILFTPFSPDRKLAKMVQCAAQLRWIGNATGMYHNDYNNKNPIPWSDKVQKAGFGQGWYNATDSNEITRWCDPNWKSWDNFPTVGGCLYLLVKYEDVHPKAFVCLLASEDEEMDLYDAKEVCKANGWDIPVDFDALNDFQNGCNLSYSMNDPQGNPMDSSSPEGMPFMADKSNKFDTETFSERAHTGSGPNYQRTGYWTDKKDKSGADEGHGNSNNHGTENQNVLFMGGHVERFETPMVGIEGDNIYTRWDESVSPVDTQIGKWGKGIFSADRKDAYLGN
jgi:hypothetical protein